VFGDPRARVIILVRRSKKRRAVRVGQGSGGGTTARFAGHAICPAATRASTSKWQRLKPYKEFAEMIDGHWEGIAAYCKPENKVSLGFVEGLNNKIRVIQRRAYGLRDEEYLRSRYSLACCQRSEMTQNHPHKSMKSLFFLILGAFRHHTMLKGGATALR